jgi:AcrR family transcriptional regulator
MDPRIARTRAAVVRAATDLLVEGGPAAVTVDAIVARSGVAKSTIYRHWETRDDILRSVLERCIPDLAHPPAELDFAAALRALTAEVVALLNDPEWKRILPALLLLGLHEDGIADLEQQMEEQQDHVFAEVLERGIAEGVIRADTDIRQAAATWLGPLLWAHLTGRLPLDDALAEHAVVIIERVYGAC